MVRAEASWGSSSTARLMCSSARPCSPNARNAAPKLVWAIASSGRDSSTASERAGRLAVSPQHMQGQPKVVAGGGIVQPESNRLTTASNGFFELAQGTMDLGQRGVEDGDFRAQGHGLADQPGGQSIPALLMAQHSKEVKSVGMSSIVVQDRLIQVVPQPRGHLPGAAGPPGRIHLAKS